MFTNKPGIQKFNLPGPRSLINVLGYQGPLPPRNKPASAYRIFILGASVVFNGNPSISYLLQDIYAEHGKSNVEVYNYGVVSSVSRQELVRTLIEISTYQPDLIISFGGYTDVFNTGWDRRVNYPHRFVLFEYNPLMTMRAADFPFYLNFLMSSEILRNIFEDRILKLIVDTHGTMPIDVNLRQQKVIEAYVQNLRLTNLLAHNFGAQFLAFFEPTVYFKKPATPFEQEIIKNYAREPAAMIRQAVLAEQQKFKSEFKLIDTSEMFNGESRQVFKDPVHFSAQYANDFVADYLYKQVKKNINMNARLKTLVPHLIPEDDFILGDSNK